MKMTRGIFKVKKTCFGVMCLFIIGSAKAQDSVTVDLQQAIEIALSDNPTIKISDNTIAIKNYVKKETDRKSVV